MKWIGLTGTIGSGKSTVASIFAGRGIPVINTDQIAHEVIRKGALGYAPLLKRYSEVILGSDGEIDRKKLAIIIFQDEAERKFVEQLLHPLIRDEVKALAQKIQHEKKRPPFCIIEVPLLFETSWDRIMDATIVVWCDPTEALGRASQSLNISLKEAQLRSEAQMSTEEKKRLATYVIDNSGSLEATRAQVQAVYQKLMAEK